MRLDQRFPLFPKGSSRLVLALKDNWNQWSETNCHNIIIITDSNFFHPFLTSTFSKKKRIKKGGREGRKGRKEQRRKGKKTPYWQCSVCLNHSSCTYICDTSSRCHNTGLEPLLFSKVKLSILCKRNGNHMDEICRHQRERGCGQAFRVMWALGTGSTGGKPCDLVKPAPFTGLWPDIYSAEHPSLQSLGCWFTPWWCLFCRIWLHFPAASKADGWGGW